MKNITSLCITPLLSQAFLQLVLASAMPAMQPLAYQDTILEAYETYDSTESTFKPFLFPVTPHEHEQEIGELEKHDSEVVDKYEKIYLIPDDLQKNEHLQSLHRRSFLFEDPVQKAKGQLSSAIAHYRHSKPYRPRPPRPMPPPARPFSTLLKRNPDPKRLPEGYVRSKNRKLAETSPHIFGVGDVLEYDQYFSELEQMDYDPNFMAAVVGKEAARNHVPIKDVLAFIRHYDKAIQDEKKKKELEKQISGDKIGRWDEQDQKYFENYAEQQALNDVKEETNDAIGYDVPRRVLVEGRGKNLVSKATGNGHIINGE